MLIVFTYFHVPDKIQLAARLALSIYVFYFILYFSLMGYDLSSGGLEP